MDGELFLDPVRLSWFAGCSQKSALSEGWGRPALTCSEAGAGAKAPLQALQAPAQGRFTKEGVISFAFPPLHCSGDAAALLADVLGCWPRPCRGFACVAQSAQSGMLLWPCLRMCSVNSPSDPYSPAGLKASCRVPYRAQPCC